MIEERMTVATVDICPCGSVMHQCDADDYGTLGSVSGTCCHECGNEKFTTIEQLQAELDKALKALRNLHDVQNGPPLLRHEKQWQAAYDEAGNVLEKMEPQFKPANKCITPGCGSFIDTNYCTKCREDWAS